MIDYSVKNLVEKDEMVAKKHKRKERQRKGEKIFSLCLFLATGQMFPVN
jgi:hypothetical protein